MPRGRKKAGEKTVDPITVVSEYVDVIQEYVDKHITAGVSMPARVVYEGLKDQLSDDVTEAIFIPGFSASVRAGTITGIKGFKRWGYRRVSDAVPSEEPTDDSENPEPVEPDDDSKLTIMITKKLRVHYLDNRNWAVQTHSGDGAWLTKAYLPDLPSALKSAARKLLNKELGRKSVLIDNMDELIREIRDAEARIIEKINKSNSVNIEEMEPEDEEEEEEELDNDND